MGWNYTMFSATIKGIKLKANIEEYKENICGN